MVLLHNQVFPHVLSKNGTEDLGAKNNDVFALPLSTEHLLHHVTDRTSHFLAWGTLKKTGPLRDGLETAPFLFVCIHEGDGDKADMTYFDLKRDGRTVHSHKARYATTYIVCIPRGITNQPDPATVTLACFMQLCVTQVQTEPVSKLLSTQTLYFSLTAVFWGDQSKNEMGGACGTNERHDRCIQGFGGEA